MTDLVKIKARLGSRTCTIKRKDGTTSKATYSEPVAQGMARALAADDTIESIETDQITVYRDGRIEDPMHRVSRSEFVDIPGERRVTVRSLTRYGWEQPVPIFLDSIQFRAGLAQNPEKFEFILCTKDLDNPETYVRAQSGATLTFDNAWRETFYATTQEALHQTLRKLLAIPVYEWAYTWGPRPNFAQLYRVVDGVERNAAIIYSRSDDWSPVRNIKDPPAYVKENQYTRLVKIGYGQHGMWDPKAQKTIYEEYLEHSDVHLSYWPHVGWAQNSSGWLRPPSSE